MSEQELNSYRFVSGSEPGDERLDKIMEEVVRDAMIRRERVETSIRQDLKVKRTSLREKWLDRVNNAIHG